MCGGVYSDGTILYHIYICSIIIDNYIYIYICVCVYLVVTYILSEPSFYF